MEVYVVIMAGGIGSRFWPLSQKHSPKQFLDILGTGKSLIRETVDRFKKICNEKNIIIVTNSLYENLIKEQIPELPLENILFEPLRKNTAPCIAYAYKEIERRNKNAIMVVSPSDHYIGNEDLFLETIKEGVNFVANNNCLLTIGIQPTRPETGYGYIQISPDQKAKSKILKVKTFTEKPNHEMASFFIKSGDFYWNSGIFLWSVSSIKEAYEKHLPEIYFLFEDYFQNISDNKDNNGLLYVYSESPSISVDYGIMEKAQNVFVIKGNFTWSDLGTWGSLLEHLPKDSNNNIVRANSKCIIHNSHNNYIQLSNNKTVIVNSVNNLIIVENDNQILISDLNNEQELRNLVNLL
ncbi:MAG: mannose-1-phosphate guanylyltransferase [Bacteroidales bacterium]|nr:mannose-1-phosphate guanylyltransferase [Bacteroidales bacterium]